MLGSDKRPRPIFARDLAKFPRPVLILIFILSLTLPPVNCRSNDHGYLCSQVEFCKSEGGIRFLMLH